MILLQEIATFNTLRELNSRRAEGNASTDETLRVSKCHSGKQR
jgi:hypothetical protein